MKNLRLLSIILLTIILFIGCKDKKEVTISDIKDASLSVMNKDEMTEADTEMTESFLEIEKSDYEEVIYFMPSSNIKATQVLVLKVNDSQKDTTEEKVKAYLDRQTELFSTYVEDEYKLLQDAEFFTENEFIILLVGENASKAKEEIEKLF